ncbi:UNVERIFIED_CONTAM: hypothetical protein FKN15_017303 [Acipenser sinensis]
MKLSCKVSGFTMTSYYMHWIRQHPGEALEWVGRIDSGSGKEPLYTESLKGRFTITEDVPSSMLYLQGSSLKTEDSAVYYCARYPQ